MVTFKGPANDEAEDGPSRRERVIPSMNLFSRGFYVSGWELLYTFTDSSTPIFPSYIRLPHSFQQEQIVARMSHISLSFQEGRKGIGGE
jgi:hypothetical protein